MSVVTVPDMWIAGYLRTHPEATTEDAVLAWELQGSLAAECDHRQEPQLCCTIPANERCERCLLRIR